MERLSMRKIQEVLRPNRSACLLARSLSACKLGEPAQGIIAIALLQAG